jgi:hypothetical protein
LCGGVWRCRTDSASNDKHVTAKMTEFRIQISDFR